MEDNKLPRQEGVDVISLLPSPVGDGVVSVCLCSFQGLACLIILPRFD